MDQLQGTVMNQDHADSFAAMQRALGKRAVSRCEYGWHYVEYGKQVTPVKLASAPPTRRHDAIQAEVDRWF